MQFISGRIVFIGNNRIINRSDYQFSSVFFVIKKRMDGKVRNICFECFGKVADYVLKLNLKDKVEVKYWVNSSLYKDKWYTNLHAKEVEQILAIKEIDKQQLNFYSNE